MTDTIKLIIAIVVAIALVILAVFIEEWRISSIKKSLKDYEAVHAQDIQAVSDAQSALQRAISDSQKANDLLAHRAETAEKSAQENAIRYQQITGVKDADDGKVAPVLAASLERLRGTATASTGHELSMFGSNLYDRWCGLASAT